MSAIMIEAATIRMPLKLAVVMGLWLVAGLICGVFSDINVEAGESLLAARVEMVFLAPLWISMGVGYAVMQPLQLSAHGRDLGETIISLALFWAFVAQAVIALTRKNVSRFVLWAVVQVVTLAVGVALTLHFWHWNALRMHG